MIWVLVILSLFVWFMAFVTIDPEYDSLYGALTFATVMFVLVWVVFGVAYGLTEWLA